MRWTDPQRQWLQVTAPIALMRGGNQLGKSVVQAADAAMFARNVHPYDQTHTGPVDILVGSQSWKQFDPFLKKLWESIPDHEKDPKCRYVSGQGIKGYKEPCLKLVDGPGAGSVFYFFTYDAGPKRLAGFTGHRGYLDEPPPEEFWGEFLPRMNVHGGHVRVSFTPTPKAPPQLHFRKMVQVWEDAGRPSGGCVGGCFEHHVVLTPEACIPRGGMYEIPFVTEEDIEQFRMALLPHERMMRINGAWEPVLKGRWLDFFDEEASVHGFRFLVAPGPPRGALLMVGVDHGAGPGKQAAALLAVDVRDQMFPRVWLLGTTVAKGYTTPEQDARAIFDELLTPWGLKYGDIDEWVGDRSTNPNQYSIKKGNAQLKTHLARIAGIPARKAKWINTPRKFASSVEQGFRNVNAIMARRDDRFKEVSHFVVHPKCKAFIEACHQWRGSKNDPHKDILDAVRYAVERAMVIGDVQHDISSVIGYIS